MSGSGTPYLNLIKLDPSQSQPEVKINDAWDKIDAAVQDAGGSITIKQVGDSPAGDVFHVREIHIEGATVTRETGDVAVITITSSGSGGTSGGASLPPGGTIHQVLTKLSSANGDADWETPASGGAGGSGARITLTGNQTVATATDVLVNFDTAEFDVGGFIQTSPASSFVAPVAGVFVVSASVLWDSATTGSRKIYFVVNRDASNPVGGADTPSTLASIQLSISAVLDLAEGDSVEVWARHDDGSSIDIIADHERTTFGIAQASSASGGTGGNITPDAHPSSAASFDDEFEDLSLDGKWSWANQGAASVVLTQGALHLTSDVNASGDMNLLVQSLSGAGAAWKFRTKMSVFLQADTNDSGLIVYESGTGKTVRLATYHSGSIHLQVAAQTALTGYSTSSIYDSSSNVVPFFALNSFGGLYFEVELASGTLHFRYSLSGYEGSFIEIATAAVASYFTSAPDSIGVFAESNNGSTASQAFYDWFRRIS